MELQQNTSRITWDGGDALKNREAQSFRRCISAVLWSDQHLTQIELTLQSGFALWYDNLAKIDSVDEFNYWLFMHVWVENTEGSLGTNIWL